MKIWIKNSLQWIRETFTFTLLDTPNGERMLRQIFRTGEFEVKDEPSKKEKGLKHSS